MSRNDASEGFVPVGHVEFPPPQDININMMPFVMGDISSLPSEYQHYWDLICACPIPSKKYKIANCRPRFRRTAAGMVRKEIGRIGYLTVQESFVRENCTQRRGGVHVDMAGTLMKEGGKVLFGTWGGGFHVEGEAGTATLLAGGIYMASNVQDSTMVWNCQISDPSIVGPLGDVSHLRPSLGKGLLIDEGQLVWLTDATPHESLPLKQGRYRQFFRLVTSSIAVWYADHSTPNRLGIEPQAEIIHGNKFVCLGTIPVGNSESQESSDVSSDGVDCASESSDSDGVYCVPETSDSDPERDFDHAARIARLRLDNALESQSNNAWHKFWQAMQDIKKLQKPSFLTRPYMVYPWNLVSDTMALESAWYCHSGWASAVRNFGEIVNGYWNCHPSQTSMDKLRATIARTDAHDAWLHLEHEQKLLRNGSEAADADRRDERRAQTLDAVESWIIAEQRVSRALQDDYDLLQLAYQRQAFLQEGMSFNASDAVSDLKQCRHDHLKARKQLREAADLVDEAIVEGGDLAHAKDAEAQARSAIQQAEKHFANKWSVICQLAMDHAPEWISQIVEVARSRLVSELRSLCVSLPDTTKVFHTERTLQHYGPLSEMEVMSQFGANHRVLGTRYNDTPCVLKGFQLSSGSGLRDFLHEVEHHSRLKHPLITPVIAAFIEEQSLCGYLHFNRHHCDLGKWVESRQLTGTDVLRAVVAMSTSVAHLHSLGVVHGGIKPSNFLLQDGIPLLSDFETLHATQPSGCTVTKTVRFTIGFTAPELCMGGLIENGRDVSARATIRSDMFALGRTIDVVIGASPLLQEPVLLQLSSLSEAMTHSCPEQRPSASDSLATVLTVLEEPGQLLRHGLTSESESDWGLSERMLHKIRFSWQDTFCRGCARFSNPYFHLHGVEHIKNSILWRAFVSKKATMAAIYREYRIASQRVDVRTKAYMSERSSGNLNEAFLFHGCTSDVVDIVANFGFDERVANPSDLYGAGSYFTDELCKALPYSRAEGCSVRQKRCRSWYCQCPGQRCLLVCRVLLGDPYFVQPHDRLKGRRRPPDRSDVPGLQFDSVIARRGIPHPHGDTYQQHDEFVVFDGARVYPEFLVRFDVA